MTIRRIAALAVAALVAAAAPLAAQGGAQPAALDQEIDRRAAAVEGKVVTWRRDLHQHPELSYQEARTAGVVAAHLRSLGLEVRTGVGGTHGVVGVLRGGRPGPAVALRADMDALPVAELVDLPFKSTARGTYKGQDVGIMHACGHDSHVAMLMGAAEVLAGMKAQLPGSVTFLFQPAEESPPDGGAKPMIAAGALDNPKVDAVFGLHVFPFPLGTMAVRPLGLMASADNFRVVVRGRQTHGALPWNGVDPITVAAQIVLGLQTIVSRQTDATKSPSIVTVGSLHGGVRNNIIPDSATMEGTLRTFDPGIRAELQARVKRTAELIAQSAGATAEVSIEVGYPVTYNDAALTERMTATLRRVPGGSVAAATPTTTAEDFSRYQEKVPGMFFFLGVTPPGAKMDTVAANHSPKFFVDERALPVGVRALSRLAVDFLTGRK
jgi:amidohydrolase